MRSVTKTVPAPEHLGTAVAGVPAGSDVELELRLESVMEGVLVTGTARAEMTGECGRCLDPVSDELVVDLQELFTYPDDRRGAASDDGDGQPPLGEGVLGLRPTPPDALV